MKQWLSRLLTGWRGKSLLAGALAVAGAGVLAISAQAVHDLAFQLDGNTANTCPPAPDTNFCTSSQVDWNDVFDTATSGGIQTVTVNSTVVDKATPGFTEASFTRDFESGSGCTLDAFSGPFCTGDDTTFATGSKDTLDIPGWQCNHDNNVNSKIDIMNSYAAAYTAADGDRILYFGMEKNADTGTNDVGFWFLQGNATCSAPTGHQDFVGQHQIGDVLVVSEFTRGGGVSTIVAYRWVGGSNPLVQIASAQGAGGDCKNNTAGVDIICATTNSGAKQFTGNITTEWRTADKTLGVGNTVVPPDFFEGGINLTEAFKASGGGTAPTCFNTFIGDTRSSTSLTATLFDFARGRLGQCTTTLATQEQSGGPLSIGTGTVSSGTDKATLTVSGSSVWGGTLTWWLCGPVATDGCDNHGVQITSRTVTNTSPASDFVSGAANLTSAGRYCWHAHFEPDALSKAAGVQPGDDNGANECFTVNPVTPTLTTSASCTSTPCVLGVDTISDTATLTGTANRPGDNGPGGDTGLYKSINATNGAAADSSISWTLYGPSSGGCTSVKLTDSRTVSGDGTYGPVSYKPTLADGLGIYTFVATYPGDSPNTNAATPTGCPDTTHTEEVTLIGSASSASKQRWLPNDRVVLSTTGGTLNGTLTVTLYRGTFSGTSDNCSAGSATAVTGQSYTFNIAGDASGTAYNTSNSTFYVGTNPDGTAGGADGSYFWLVHYNDANLTDPTDRCESSSLTITD